MDTSLASSFPILIGTYIHHEAILDIYLFGIIVVFGVLCFLGLVWWIVIDPCTRFFGCLTLNVRSDQITQPSHPRSAPSGNVVERTVFFFMGKQRRICHYKLDVLSLHWIALAAQRCAAPMGIPPIRGNQSSPEM